MATPEYIKRANNAYNAKFDIIQLKLPKGTKERIKTSTEESYNEYIERLVLADLERMEKGAPGRTQEAETTPVNAETVNNAIKLGKTAKAPKKKPKKEIGAPENGKINAESLAELQALIDAKKAEQDRKVNYSQNTKNNASCMQTYVLHKHGKNGYESQNIAIYHGTF